MNNVQILMMNQQGTDFIGSGYLYNWSAISHSNFAPFGWHVPSYSEWTKLTDYLGGESIAGGKLKETGTVYWASPNTGATNSSGFTAIANGYRDNYGAFSSIGYYGYWWTTTEHYAGEQYYIRMSYRKSEVDYSCGFGYGRKAGMSVRLVKDWTTLSNGETSTMEDYNGNVYDTICIGTQEWIVQNWKCTKLNDGTALTKVTSDTTWGNAGTGDLYYCAYNNDESYV